MKNQIVEGGCLATPRAQPAKGPATAKPQGVRAWLGRLIRQVRR